MERTFWQSIVDADYAIPEGQQASTLLPTLLPMLGSIDPVLRDAYAYPILATWIERGLYASTELRDIGQQMAANLLHGLEGQESDAIFLRTFSVLILASVIDYDLTHPFLEEREVRAWLEAGLRYLEGERDLRGYVQEKGWAHSVSHTADLLMILAQHRYLGVADLERLLMAIAEKIRQRVAHIYLYDEDERLAYAVRKALKRDLLEMPFLTSWLQRLIELGDLPNWRDAGLNVADASAYINIRDFLRSLYFQLTLSQELPAIAPDLARALLETLRSIDLGFYTLS